MDPNTQRAEAERWLGIAAKLLTARDFLGSKTFAIRAREADPDNAVSYQMLAVVDTVLGGEKRLSTSQQPDWYAVLQLPRLVRDPDLIATNYRRLVLLLNPERNRLPFADYALQLAMDAWSVLSDPTKKWLFDNELAMSLQRSEAPWVDPIRVDPVAVAASTPPEVNTFQFFQPQSQPRQQATLPMWQQQPQQQQQSQREFMSPPPPPQPMSSGPPSQQAQQLLPQWQMRDPTPSKGVERNKGSANGIGARGAAATTSSASSAAPSPPPTTQTAPAIAVTTPRAVPESARAPTPPPPPPPPPPQGASAPAPAPVPAPVAPVVQTPSPARARARATSTIADDGNATSTNNDNTPNVASAPASATENNDDVVEEVDSFWTACPYCLYIYEYQKMYEECTLRCQNCRRAFHAAQIPNPPPISCSGGGEDKDKDNESSFCCWGFFPLGFSLAAWKKNNQSAKLNGSSNWVPFSPMFTSPTENGDGNFHWFASGVDTFLGQTNVGRNSGIVGEENFGGKSRFKRQKNVERQSGLVNNSAPMVYIDDETYMELSDPSDSDSSDRDWRNSVKNKKKVMKGRNGRKRGRPRKVDKINEENQHLTRGGGVSVGGEDLEDRSEAQEVVVGLAAGVRTDTTKNMGTSVSRKQTRRTVKDMGRLDLNVEFNNEGEEHAPALSAVNGDEDGIETIEFFEGLDEFLSTLPILNVGGDGKAKPS